MAKREVARFSSGFSHRGTHRRGIHRRGWSPLQRVGNLSAHL